MSRKSVPCAYWRDGDRCAKGTEPGVDDFCVLGPCTQEVPSNADRLRAMSDEELVCFLSGLTRCDYCPAGPCTSLFHCPQQWLEWLKSPAEGGDEDG